MKFSDAKDLLVMGAVIYGVYWIVNFIKENKDKANPLSDQNLAYQGATAVVQAATGTDETFGTWLYSMTHLYEFDVYRYSPYLKEDGSKGMRPTQLIQRSTGNIYDIVDSPLGPRAVPAS